MNRRCKARFTVEPRDWPALAVPPGKDKTTVRIRVDDRVFTAALSHHRLRRVRAKIREIGADQAAVYIVGGLNGTGAVIDAHVRVERRKTEPAN
jgi:hypothetical protein